MQNQKFSARITLLCHIQAMKEVQVMARCEICEKGQIKGHRISINRSQVSRRANRKWKPNVKKIKIVEDNGNVKSIYVCTRCMRSNKITRAI